jgi:hypothetical protein
MVAEAQLAALTSAIPPDHMPIRPAESISAGAPQLGADSPLRTTGLLRRLTRSQTEQEVVQVTISWCAEVFGTPRARFVRRYPDGAWVVHSVVHGKLVSQAADRAEIAMAWTVGLARQPLRVTRPRVTTFDGAGVRPIAVTNYLGIPVICGDEFMGVVEAAGCVSPELDWSLPLVQERLKALAERLVHDPVLRFDPVVDADMLCELAGGTQSMLSINLTGQELALLSALAGPTRLADLASETGLAVADVVGIARGLVTRNLVTLRASARPPSSVTGASTLTIELNAAG